MATTRSNQTQGTINGGSWFTINGKEDLELSKSITEKNTARLQKECFTERDVAYVAKLWRPVIDSTKVLDPKFANRLRELCKLSEVNASSVVITSHRKVLGPIIVKGKKIFTPIIQQLLKPYVLRQRIFNQSLVAAYAELGSKEPTAVNKL